jgi:hypothetical protein
MMLYPRGDAWEQVGPRLWWFVYRHENKPCNVLAPTTIVRCPELRATL